MMSSGSEVENPDDTADFFKIPLHGAIADDAPAEMLEANEMHSIPPIMYERFPDAFPLKVEGESMSRILPDGYYAIVSPCEEVDEDGKPYAACVNGFDATIKRVRAGPEQRLRAGTRLE